MRGGLAALVVGSLLVACTGTRDAPGTASPSSDARAAGAAATSTPSLRVPAPQSASDPSVRILLTREMARRALVEGELAIELADGTRYPVRMERGYDEGGDRWTVTGRVQTRLGPQSAVLTFGPDAVFGVLPQPDGRSLAITTTHGITRIGLAGGIVPKGRAPAADFVVPRGSRIEGAAAVPATVPAPANVSRAGNDNRRTGATLTAADAVPEVRVDMLGLYDSALVTLRGTASSAETEVTNLVAIANQAHRDSGSVVRLALVGLREISVPAGEQNQQVLDDITYNRINGVDIHALRDTLEADLVFVARPYTEGDPTCGIAWLAGAYQDRAYIDPRFGFSVSSVDPCGPYVFAHETGHNMGSQHDRQTAAWTIDRIPVYGAYPYSFGYRHEDAPGFATIMAYQHQLPQIGYFSNPASEACGVGCGVAERADNVRSLAQMAPVVAAFREGAPGTVSILDASAIEVDRPIQVVVRLSSAAPAGGVDVDISATGGTARAYDSANPSRFADYFTGSTRVHIDEGEHDGIFTIGMFADDREESDETILMKIVRARGVAIADGNAVATIVNDDPRPRIEGQLRFPEGYPPPTKAVDIRVRGAGDYIYLENDIQVQPPDFRYSIPFVPGNDVSLNAFPPAPFAAAQLDFGQVDGSLLQDYPMVPGVTVSGRLRIPVGGPMPAFPLQLEFHEAIDTYGRPVRRLPLKQPDEAFSFQVMPGATVYMTVSPGGPYLPFALHDSTVLADVVHDVILSKLPSLMVWGFNDLPSEGTNYILAFVELSAPASEQGVSVEYRTEAGTATPGEDYAPTSGTLVFAPGEIRKSIELVTYGDDRVEDDEYFHVVVENAQGAVVTSPRFRLDIPNDDIPLPTIMLKGEAAVAEGAAGINPTFPVLAELSEPAPAGGATVSYRAVAGTAVPGEDFGYAEGTLSFAAGETQQWILVPIYGDDVVEPDEYLDLVATPIQGAMSTPATLRITLLNDDTATEPPPPPPPDDGDPPPAPDNGDPPPPPSNPCLAPSRGGIPSRATARPCP